MFLLLCIGHIKSRISISTENPSFELWKINNKNYKTLLHSDSVVVCYCCNVLFFCFFLHQAGFIRHTVNKITFSEQCYYVFGDLCGSKFVLLYFKNTSWVSCSYIYKNSGNCRLQAVLRNKNSGDWMRVER